MPLTPNPAYPLNEKGEDADFFKAVIVKSVYGIIIKRWRNKVL
jgi:hypothetical protein